jgi:hypothetical protein
MSAATRRRAARRAALAGAGLQRGLGTERRLRALAALGWPAEALRRCAPGLAVETLWHCGEHLVTADVAARVAALYDRLSMHVGPDPAWRLVALGYGWAPPLAWDEDRIDWVRGRPAGQRMGAAA